MIAVILFIFGGLCLYWSARTFGRHWTMGYWVALICILCALSVLTQTWLGVLAGMAACLFLYDDWKEMK